MAATTWTIGWRILASRAFVPMATPTGIVHKQRDGQRHEHARQVASTPRPTSGHVAAGKVIASSTA